MISKKSKYAIKALIYIARNTNSYVVTSKEISDSEKIPKKFLETILRELRNNNILDSKQGKNGGFKLSKNPKQIKIAKILRIIDGPIAMTSCVSLNFHFKCEDCVYESCKLKNLFEDVRDKTLEILENTSIFNLI